jgi:FSR family fosmidomycin resistance protein-like MFS transporter
MRRIVTPRLGLLAFGHLTIDAYSSFFSPLLPLLMQKLALNLTLVGTLVALASVSSSFAQPLFGLLSDRVRRPWFVAFGPLTAALFMSGLGMAPNYVALVGLLMLGGVGVAAFHPQAASLAAAVSPRRGLAMAFFVTGGTLGFALGPLFSVGIVNAFGLDHTWLAVFPGLLVTGLLLVWFARVPPRAHHEAARPPLSALRGVLRPLTLLYFATVSRSAVSYGFMTFLPLHLHARGYDLTQSGWLVSLYLLLGALGGFLGGWLADRWGGRAVIVASFAASAPLYVAFLFLPDRPGLACLVAGSFVLQTSLPVNVVLGQELSPQHSSTISSLLMGAAWGVGALLVGPVGALADHRGLHSALAALTCVLAAGLVFAISLPSVRRVATPAADLAQPVAAAGESWGE